MNGVRSNPARLRYRPGADEIEATRMSAGRFFVTGAATQTGAGAIHGSQFVTFAAVDAPSGRTCCYEAPGRSPRLHSRLQRRHCPTTPLGTGRRTATC